MGQDEPSCYQVLTGGGSTDPFPYSPDFLVVLMWPPFGSCSCLDSTLNSPTFNKYMSLASKTSRELLTLGVTLRDSESKRCIRTSKLSNDKILCYSTRFSQIPTSGSRPRPSAYSGQAQPENQALRLHHATQETVTATVIACPPESIARLA